MQTSGAPFWRPSQMLKWRRRSETKTGTQGVWDGWPTLLLPGRERHELHQMILWRLLLSVTLKWSSLYMVLHTNTHTQAFIKHLDVPVSMNALTDMWPVSIGTSLTEHNTHTYPGIPLHTQSTVITVHSAFSTSVSVWQQFRLNPASLLARVCLIEGGLMLQKWLLHTTCNIHSTPVESKHLALPGTLKRKREAQVELITLTEALGPSTDWQS